MAFKHFCDKCGKEIAPEEDYFAVIIGRRYRIAGIPIPADKEDSNDTFDVCQNCIYNVWRELGCV